LKIFEKHIVFILSAAFLWGGTGVYFKELSARGADTIQIVLMRTSIAMLGLGIWLLLRNRDAFKIRVKDLWCFLGTGVLSLLCFNWFFFRAVEEVGMAVAGVLLYTAPAIVTVLSAWLFKEKLKLSGWGILAVILLGCALVSGVTDSTTDVSILGIIYGLSSGFGYALYSIFSRYALLRGYSPQTISFYTFTFCTLACIPIVIFAAEASLPILLLEPEIWILALALGTLGCLFPYWLYTKGLSGVTGATASMTATLEPVIAVLFGVLLYREVLTFWQVAGILLILGGIVLLAKTNSANTIHTDK